MSEQQAITGDQLKSVLAITRAPVKVFLLGDKLPSMRVSGDVALRMTAGGAFVGGGSARRIRYIRQVAKGSTGLWQPCWRTEGASVLPIWAPEQSAKVFAR